MKINKKNSVLATTQRHGNNNRFILQILACLKLNFKYILGTILIFTIFTYFAEWLGRCVVYGF